MNTHHGVPQLRFVIILLVLPDGPSAAIGWRSIGILLLLYFYTLIGFLSQLLAWLTGILSTLSLLSWVCSGLPRCRGRRDATTKARAPGALLHHSFLLFRVLSFIRFQILRVWKRESVIVQGLGRGQNCLSTTFFVLNKWLIIMRLTDTCLKLWRFEHSILLWIFFLVFQRVSHTNSIYILDIKLVLWTWICDSIRADYLDLHVWVI